MDGEPFRNEYLTSQWSGVSPGSIFYTGGYVGIGTVPAYALDIVDQNNAMMRLTQYNSTDGPVIRTYRALGTLAAPSGVVADSTLTAIRAFGYNSSGAFSGRCVGIEMAAAETFTSSATGTYMAFQTCASGTTTNSEKMRILGNGSVGIGVASARTGPRLWSANDVTLVSGNYAGDVACQIAAVGSTNPDKRLALMYDTTNDVGLVQAMIYGTGAKPLCLNAAGGNVGIATASPQAPLHIYKPGSGGVVQGEIRVCSDDGQKSRVGMYEESIGSTWGCWMQYNGTGDTFEFGSKRGGVDTSPQMTISSTGVITTPNRYYIMGWLAGGTTAGNYITLGSQQTGGGMAITTSNKLVAPVAGLYQFGFTTIMNATTGRNDVYMRVNGSDLVSTLNEDNGTGYHQRHASVCYYLAANDFVQFYCSSGTIYGGAGVDAWHTFYFFHIG